MYIIHYLYFPIIKILRKSDRSANIYFLYDDTISILLHKGLFLYQNVILTLQLSISQILFIPGIYYSMVVGAVESDEKHEMSEFIRIKKDSLTLYILYVIM